ncbi:hypothetical protein ABZX85_49040 [Streptomyces sp. NPDC004539]|uniref:hypothetical protein n=1 Tax=Streptomyces sp. NPDC004539 TaxID=3154280 RepID=UPI0033A49A07
MGTPEDFNSKAYLWCWGTITPTEGLGWTPLVVELVTTASVALRRWDRLPEHRQDSLTAEFAARDRRTARLAVAFLAGLSRLGLATPARMNSFDRGLGWLDNTVAGLDHADEIWQYHALRAGLPLEPFDADPYDASPAHITAAVLPRLTGCACPGFTDGERCDTPAHEGLYTAAYALNSPDSGVLHADTVAVAFRATGGPAWDAVRADLVSAVAAHVGIDARSLPRLIRPTRPHRLAEFSDLVARSAEVSEGRVSASPHEPWGAVAERVRRYAREAVPD